MSTATQSAEVFALPFMGIAGHAELHRPRRLKPGHEPKRRDGSACRKG